MPADPRIFNEDELAQVEALASVLTTEQIADYLVSNETLLDLSEARKIKSNIVYGLCLPTGRLFYIGKTINPRKRFANYKRADAHGNEKLKTILTNETVYVKVLYAGDDISNKEKELIKKHQSDIVNISGVKHEFFNSRGKPWQAGSGIRCQVMG